MANEFVKSEQLKASFRGMAELPLLRQLGLLLGLTASIALAVYIVLWSGAVGYPSPGVAAGANHAVLDNSVSPASDPGASPVASVGTKHLAWDVGRQLLGGFIAVLVLLGVLRPMMRRLAASPTANQATVREESDMEQNQVMLPDDDTRHISQADEDELNLDLVKAMVSQEPRRVAQVVKQWLNES